MSILGNLNSYKDQNYSRFDVQNNVIKMSSNKRHRSIAIKNISSISIVSRSRAMLVMMLIIAGVAGIIIYLNLPPMIESRFAFLSGGAVLIIVAIMIQRKWYLAISTNDGAFNLFEGEYDFLVKTKNLLDGIINAGSVAKNVSANFNIGKIESVEHLGDRYSPAE